MKKIWGIEAEKVRSVRDILETYKLSERLKDRLTYIASTTIEEKGLETFDEKYEYIADLIEKFLIPFGEKVALRLDSKVKIDSRTEFYNFLGLTDPNIDKLFQDECMENGEEERISEGIMLKDAMGILEGQLDTLDLKLIHQLSTYKGKRDHRLNISAEEITTSLPSIQSRLDQLVTKYEKDGRLIIPKRPIIQIKFDPLSIKFRRRFYDGNPLAYFKKHYSHLNLKRRDLLKLDLPLCHALYKYNQLDEAIPEKMKPIKVYEDPLEYFKEHYGNTEIRRSELAFKERGLYDKLRGEGILGKAIPIKERKKLEKDDMNLIIESYEKYNKSASKAARHLPYSAMTITKYWRREGLEVRKSGDHGLEVGEINNVIEAYQTYKGNSEEAAKHLSYSSPTIRKHWRNVGLKIYKSGNRKGQKLKRRKNI